MIIKVVNILLPIFLFTSYSYGIHLCLDNDIGRDECLLLDSYNKVKENFTVVIDAGHGGKDPGTIGKKSKEKDIALAIALQTGKLIKKAHPHINIIYTRQDDTFIPIFQRIKMANETKADLFISIHCNASSKSKASGTETFVMGLHRAEENLEVAKRENSAILLEKEYQNNYNGFDPNSDAGHIILSMYQNLYLDQSIEFANLIENSLGVKTSRGVKQAGFVVLRQATMPAILIETGFLSNPHDEAKLLSKKGQSDVATAITTAFGKYKNLKEKQEISVENEKTPEGKKTKNLEISGSAKFFSVQIAAVNKKQDDIFMDVPQLFYRKINNFYKYYSGVFEEKTRAMEAKQKLRRLGYQGAFIVALDLQEVSFVQKRK